MKARFISMLLCLVLTLCSFPLEADAAGYREASSRAETLPAFTENTARFSVGNNYCLAILDDNTLWGWGLGNLTLGRYYSEEDFIYKPAKIMDGVKSVFAGPSTAMAVRTDNSLWIWGCYTWGEGEDRLTFALKPEKIMDNVSWAAAGSKFVLVVKADGTLWAWGDNTYPRLVEALKVISHHKKSTFYKPVTEPIKLMDGVKKAVCSNESFCVLKNDGTLLEYAGNAQSPDGGLPFDVTISDIRYRKLAENVKDVFMNDFVTFFVKTDNSLWGIGQFTYEGRLDSGNREYAPVKIMDGAKYAAVTCDLQFALKTDGKLVAWGSEIDLETRLHGKEHALKTLDDLRAYYDAMKKYKTIVLADNVSEIGAYYNQMLIKKNDGSIWTWGFNEHGGLGDGQERSNTLRSDKAVRLEFGTAAEQLFISGTQKSRLLSDWIAEAEASVEIPAYNRDFKADWNGYWDTHPHADLEFVQIGDEVFVYGFMDALAAKGTINGNKLKGQYHEGVFELTMMPDNKSFTGLIFINGSAEPVKWTGKKL